MAALPTNFQTNDPLTHDQINAVMTAANTNTDAVTIVTTNLTTTQTGLTAAQSVANANQNALLAANQTIATQAAAIATLQAAITAAQARLTVLETVAAPPPVPGAPTGLTAGTITTSSVALTWVAPVGGTAPTSYQTRSARQGTGNWVNGPLVTAPTVTATVTGLTPATAYDFDVVSIAASGPGGVSFTITRTTTSAFVPSPGGTSIPPASTIVMANGDLITVLGGVVQIDTGTGPVPLGISSNVILAYLNNAGVLYQESNDPSLSGLPGGVGWWYYDPTQSYPWVFSSDPRPVGPGNPTTKSRLLSYLNQISGNHTLSGQVSHSNGDYINGNTSALGVVVACDVREYWMDASTTFDGAFSSQLLSHATAGGIIGIGAFIPNLTNGGSAQGGVAVNATRTLQAGTSERNNLNGYLDQIASGLQTYKDAGRAVMWRPFHEMDGNWFWWGTGNFSAAQFIQLWIYCHDYLTVTKGLDNLLFVWSPNVGPGVYQNLYPGDAYVDIVGMDGYTDTPSTYTTGYNNIRSLAPSKPIGFAEFGFGDTNTVHSGDDARTMVTAIKASMPRICYVIMWSGWAWSQISNSAAALADPYMINRNGVVIP